MCRVKLQLSQKLIVNWCKWCIAHFCFNIYLVVLAWKIKSQVTGSHYENLHVMGDLYSEERIIIHPQNGNDSILGILGDLQWDMDAARNFRLNSLIHFFAWIVIFCIVGFKDPRPLQLWAWIQTYGNRDMGIGEAFNQSSMPDSSRIPSLLFSCMGFHLPGSIPICLY